MTKSNTFCRTLDLQAFLARMNQVRKPAQVQVIHATKTGKNSRRLWNGECTTSNGCIKI